MSHYIMEPLVSGVSAHRMIEFNIDVVFVCDGSRSCYFGFACACACLLFAMINNVLLLTPFNVL